MTSNERAAVELIDEQDVVRLDAETWIEERYRFVGSTSACDPMWLYECRVCGALVESFAIHEGWHVVQPASGQIPVVRFGGAIRIPVAWLRRKLAETETSGD